MGRGVFGYATWYNLSAITDGTSNTALFSERCVSSETGGSYPGYPMIPLSEPRRVKEAAMIDTQIFPLWGGVFTYTRPDTGTPMDVSILGDRSYCMNTRDGNEYKAQYGVRGHYGWGIVETYGYQNGFHTALPPNAPSCLSYVPTFAVLSASSDHAGGVHLALADGSVRFISETIDIGTGNVAVHEGPSPFGIWGAVGTRNGNEATALP